MERGWGISGGRPSIAACAVALAAFALAGAPRTSIAAVPESVIEERLEAGYSAGKDLVRDPALDHELERIVTRIRSANPDAADLAVRIHALRGTLPSAFALQNGALYVSTGLIARLGDEAELAAVIAAQLASVIRHDTTTGESEVRAALLRRLIPNLLAIGATIGLAGGAISRADTEARDKILLGLQAQSDAVALHWLAQSGYDPAAFARGLKRLSHALSAEQRSDTTELANVKALDARIAQLGETVATDPPLPSAGITPASLAGAPASIPRDWFRPAARRFELDIATQDLERSNGVGFLALLEAVDRDDGAGGVTALMRADYLRQTRADLASLPEVIGAYQACTAFKDAPPRAFRELGYLHRRNGEPALARADFLEYLKRAPTAADAPIVRSYLESP